MLNYNKVLDNYVNGNLSDFRKQVKAMTKLQIIGLIKYVKSGEYGAYPKVFNILIALERHLDT